MTGCACPVKDRGIHRRDCARYAPSRPARRRAYSPWYLAAFLATWAISAVFLRELSAVAHYGWWKQVPEMSAMTAFTLGGLADALASCVWAAWTLASWADSR